MFYIYILVRELERQRLSVAVSGGLPRISQIRSCKYFSSDINWFCMLWVRMVPVHVVVLPGDLWSFTSIYDAIVETIFSCCVSVIKSINGWTSSMFPLLNTSNWLILKNNGICLSCFEKQKGIILIYKRWF